MTSRRTFAAALLAAGLLCIAVYVASDGFGRIGTLAAILTDPKAITCDFFQNWAAAVDHSEGRGIYEPLNEDFDRFASRLGPAYGPDEHSPYSGWPGLGPEKVLDVNAHPPFATLLVVPLARQPLADAHRTFAVINLLLLAVVAALLVTAGGPGLPGLGVRVGLFVPFLAFFAASAPLFGQFVNGNWNVVLLLLITLGWRLAGAGRPGLAGVAVGVAALIKIYPGLLAAYFLLPGRRRGLLTVAATVALGGLLTVGVFGLQTHFEYVGEVLPRIKMQTSVLNTSLAATAGRLFDPAQPDVVPLVRSKALLLAYLAAAAGVVLAPVGWAVLWRGRLANPDGVYAALVTASLLLSPVSYLPNWLQGVLPAWVVLLAAVRARNGGVLVMAALCGCVLWSSQSDLIHWTHADGGAYQPWESLTVLSTHTYAGLLLHGLACWVALTGPNAEAAEGGRTLGGVCSKA